MRLKKNLIYFLLIFLIPLISADTTFFDNPDDFFIMGSSATTGEVTTGTAEGTTNGGSCKYEWNCTDWSKCLLFGKQIRNCTNVGTCSDTYKTPITEQNCTYSFEGEMIVRKIIDKKKVLICCIIIFIIGFIILYLKKNYFKKLIKKQFKSKKQHS